jgi:uncharacterized protein YigA (DUF484 family)
MPSSSCKPTVADFDFQHRVEITARHHELEERNRQYLLTHPELQERLHDIMEAVLFHKPQDALTFVQEQVKLHRESHEDHVSAL